MTTVFMRGLNAWSVMIDTARVSGASLMPTPALEPQPPQPPTQGHAAPTPAATPHNNQTTCRYPSYSAAPATHTGPSGAAPGSAHHAPQTTPSNQDGSPYKSRGPEWHARQHAAPPRATQSRPPESAHPNQSDRTPAACNTDNATPRSASNTPCSTPHAIRGQTVPRNSRTPVQDAPRHGHATTQTFATDCPPPQTDKTRAT